MHGKKLKHEASDGNVLRFNRFFYKESPMKGFQRTWDLLLSQNNVFMVQQMDNWSSTGWQLLILIHLHILLTYLALVCFCPSTHRCFSVGGGKYFLQFCTSVLFRLDELWSEMSTDKVA